MKIVERKELDKFYTKKEIALLCYEEYKKLVPANSFFIEPSAGSGSFLDIIVEDKLGFDIAPEKTEIIKLDFLKDDISIYLKENSIFLGNPPFGKKSKLAIEFLNKCLDNSNFVGFIVPIQFRKWSVQSKINEDAKLVLDLDLPLNAFALGDKDYSVQCCFQVWTNTGVKNLRIKRPDVDHDDFIMYQYNRTEDAEKFFSYDWDFATYRQGYLDYTLKVYDEKDCDRKQQWIFFKAKNEKILSRLLELDFVKLSKLNTTTPGFGKADVVKEYTKLYGKKKSKIEVLFG